MEKQTNGKEKSWGQDDGRKESGCQEDRGTGISPIANQEYVLIL